MTIPQDCKMAMGQNLVPLVNIKIAGKWMFIPLKMVLIGIDPYPDCQTRMETRNVNRQGGYLHIFAAYCRRNEPHNCRKRFCELATWKFFNRVGSHLLVSLGLSTFNQFFANCQVMVCRLYVSSSSLLRLLRMSSPARTRHEKNTMPDKVSDRMQDKM